jgi:hypothetical protein
MATAVRKQNNNRKYPLATRQPRHKDAQRKLLAQARQEVYNGLTLEQKMAALPPESSGLAKKVRSKLNAALEKKNAKTASKKEETSVPASS